MIGLRHDKLRIKHSNALYINGLLQERRNSIANALELRLSCTNPSILYRSFVLYCAVNSFYLRHRRFGSKVNFTELGKRRWNIWPLLFSDKGTTCVLRKQHVEKCISWCLLIIVQQHTTWVTLCFKSPVNWLFVHQLVRVNKEKYLSTVLLAICEWTGGAMIRKAFQCLQYIDVIMTTLASQITSLMLVNSTVYSDADQRKHQSSALLAFVWGIHRDRWIPRTKGLLRGKCFHLMTSSCDVVILCVCQRSIPVYFSYM